MDIALVKKDLLGCMSFLAAHGVDTSVIPEVLKIIEYWEELKALDIEHNKMIKELEAELARLRSALEKIAEQIPNGTTKYGWLENIKFIVRKSLNKVVEGCQHEWVINTDAESPDSGKIICANCFTPHPNRIAKSALKGK
jgi:hypothetical protein